MLDGQVILEYDFIISKVTKDLFPMSLTNAIKQDGGLRLKRDDIFIFLQHETKYSFFYLKNSMIYYMRHSGKL